MLISDRASTSSPTVISSPAKAHFPDGTRDLRLDMFRGLALLMIFVNHVPGTAYEHFTSRNFGFSDAAEAFVLMSGMAAGLAYSRHFRGGLYWPGVARIWARARQLYFVHVVTTAIALAIFATAAVYFDLPQVLRTNNLVHLFEQPLRALIGIPLLSYQLGYFNILPLYAALLFATPVFLLVGVTRPHLLLTGSAVVWLAANQFGINFPNYPDPGGWFFNPFAWQLVFVVGLMAGTGMKLARPLITYHPGLFWTCAAYLLVVLAWVKVPAIGGLGLSALGWLSDQGLPSYVVWFEKSALPLPRLLHVLALAYVLSSLPSIGKLARSRAARPLALLGRHGLPVFATGSLLCMVFQVTKVGIGSSFLADTAMLGGGIALQYLLALALSASSRLTNAIPAISPAQSEARVQATRYETAQAGDGLAGVAMPAPE